MRPTALSNLLPGSTYAVERFAPFPRRERALFPSEAAVVAHSEPKRRHEFAAVRDCAREALIELGLHAKPILPGEMGAPIWPGGVVGSMTHCVGYCGAVVARKADYAAIGIDAEPNAPLPEGLLDLVRLQDDVLPPRHASMNVSVDRLLFSAKESVYKAWFPLTQRYVDLSAVMIELRPDFTFRARILADCSGWRQQCHTGRWGVTKGVLLTAIALEPAGDRG